MQTFVIDCSSPPKREPFCLASERSLCTGSNSVAHRGKQERIEIAVSLLRGRLTAPLRNGIDEDGAVISLPRAVSLHIVADAHRDNRGVAFRSPKVAREKVCRAPKEALMDDSLSL